MAEAANKHLYDSNELGTSAAPSSIYGLTSRNLDRSDAILRSATQSFCATRRRSPNEISSYAKLVRPLLADADKKTLRWVAACLAKCEFSPSDICRMLSNQSIAIAAPILAIANKLSVEDQVNIAKSKTREHRVLLAQREMLDTQVIDEILLHAEAEPARHILRKKPQGLTKNQTSKAVTIVARAMDEHYKAEAAAKKLATNAAANVPAPAAAPAEDVDEANLAPSELLAKRIKQFTDIKDEISSRTRALEKARNKLVGMATTSQKHAAAGLEKRSEVLRQTKASTPSMAVRAQQEKIRAEMNAHAASLASPSTKPDQAIRPSRNANHAQNKQAVATHTNMHAASSTKAISATMSASNPKKRSHELATDITQAIARLDQTSFQLEVEKLLGLSSEKIEEMTSETSLQTLSVALKAVRCPTLLARQILTAAHMFSKRDVARINNLLRAYEMLDADECRMALKMWQKQHPKQDKIVISGTLQGQTKRHENKARVSGRTIRPSRHYQVQATVR